MLERIDIGATASCSRNAATRSGVFVKPSHFLNASLPKLPHSPMPVLVLAINDAVVEKTIS